MYKRQRKYFTLLKKTYNIDVDICIRNHIHTGKSRTYILDVADDYACLLYTSRIYGRDMTPEQIEKLLEFYEDYDCPMEAFICGVPYTSKTYFDHPENFGAGPLSVNYVRTTRHPVPDMRNFVKRHENEIEGINFIVQDVYKRQLF